MRKSKYILSAILIFAALIIYGESRVLNVITMTEQSHSCATYQIDRCTASDEPEEIAEILKFVNSCADKNNCAFYISDSDSDSNLSTTQTVYCYDDDKAKIQSDLALKSNTVNSLILGDWQIKYDNIENIPEINSRTLFKFIGDIDNIRALHTEISEAFYCSGLSEYNGDYSKRYDIASFAIFGFAIFVISVFSFFQSGIEKKEVAIRVSCGEKKSTLLLKNIACDSAVYLLIFVCIAGVLSQFDNVCEDMRIIVGFYFALVLFNALAYCGLLKTDAALVMRGKKLDNKALAFNYIMKFCISLTVIFAVSVFSLTVKSSEKYIKAKKFFSSLSDYSFCYLEPVYDFSDMSQHRDATAKLYETLYRNYSDECEPIVLAHKQYDDNTIYANINAVDYISSAISSWDAKTSGYDFVVIIHNGTEGANYTKTHSALDVICLTESLESDEFTYKIVTVDDKYQLVAFNSDLDEYFTFLDNPTVIINTHQPDDPLCDIEDENRNSMYTSMLFKIDDDIISSLNKQVPIYDSVITDSKELYQHYFNITLIEFVFLMLLTALSIVLHIILIITITRFEFLLNEKELCIKKILGYSLVSRYLYIFETTLTVDLISLGIAIALLKIAELEAFGVAIIACIVMILSEAAIICRNASKLEKQSINKILKDGAF